MCDEKLYYFDTSSMPYSSIQKVNVPYLCNAISIKNTGNTICLFDEEPLQPGESKSIGGNRGEILFGRHDIAFTIVGMAVPPAVPFNQAYITSKFYIPTPSGAKTSL